jgi:hypothetical protein
VRSFFSRAWADSGPEAQGCEGDGLPVEEQGQTVPFQAFFMFADDLVFACNGCLDLWRAQNRYSTLAPGHGDLAVRCRCVKEPRLSGEAVTGHTMHHRDTDRGEIL